MRRLRFIVPLLLVLGAFAVALPALAGTENETNAPVPSSSVALTATVSTRAVALRWRPGAGAVAVKGYFVWRRDNPGFHWTEIGQTRAPTYTDATVAAGKGYAYAVRAYHSAGSVSASSAIVTASVPAAMAAASAGGSAVWTADGERPLNQQWAEYSTATHCAVTSDQVTSDPEVLRESSVVAQGSYAYEFVVSNRDDNKCYGGARTEIGQGLPERAYFSGTRRFTQGDDRWFSFQVRFGRDFPVSNPNWDVIAQWKQNLSTTLVPGPMLVLNVSRNRLWLVVAGGTADPNWSDEKGVDLGHVTTGRWIKITMHIKFDTDPRVGFVEVYRNPGGTRVRLLMPLRHFSTLATDASGNPVRSNARIGIYRSAMITGTAHLYIDGYTVATTRLAAEANAFDSSR
jgi:hypothetical protein